MAVPMVKLTSNYNINSKLAWGMRDSRMKTHALVAARAAVLGWGKYIQEIGGYRSDCEHCTGASLDIMCRGNTRPAAGSDVMKAFDEMAAFFVKYAKEYKVCGIIWKQRSRYGSSGNLPSSWKGMGNCGSNTCNHWDHIHLALKGGGGGCCCKCCGDSYPDKGFAVPAPPRLLQMKTAPSGVEGWKPGSDSQGGKNKGKKVNTPTANPNVQTVSSIPTGTFHLAALYGGRLTEVFKIGDPISAPEWGGNGDGDDWGDASYGIVPDQGILASLGAPAVAGP